METLLAGLIVLGILVIAHEFGHLVAGLRLGVTVLKFSVGFGPKVVGFTWNGIEWVISAIPFGGFVKFAGDEPGGEEEEEESTPDPGDFLTQPWWVKTVVAVAGPGMNVVLAFVLFYVVSLIGLRISDPDLIVGMVEAHSPGDSIGLLSGDRIVELGGREVDTWFDLMEVLAVSEKNQDVGSLALVVSRASTMDTLLVDAKGGFLEGIGLSVPPVVGEVSIGLPAFEAGLQEGDSIVVAGGQPIQTYEEFRKIIQGKADEDLELCFVRKGKLLTTTIRPMNGESVGAGPGGLIGIMSRQGKQRAIKFGPLEGLVHSAEMTIGIAGNIYSGLYRIVKNPRAMRRQLGGPIAIAQLSAKEAKKGLDSIISFVAIISVMLAVVNLLPIPILDGGMVLFSLIEGVRQKPLGLKSQLVLQRIGYAFLVTLMAFSLANDVERMWKRRKAIKSPVEVMQKEQPQETGIGPGQAE